MIMNHIKQAINMKNIQLLLCASIFSGIIFSCEQKEKTTPSESEKKTLPQDSLSQADLFMQYENAKKMKEIDQRINPKNRVESLRWEKQTKDHGSEFIEVVAYLNEDGMPMKITEFFIGGNFRPQGERHFYLENNKIIGFQENADFWVDSLLTNYSEKRTVYNDNKPVLTQFRTAYQYNEIQDSTWKIIPEEHHSLKTVNKILTGSDEFQTHFISVIKGEHLFLLLGENKPQTEERYTTAVRVDKMTPFIGELLSDLDKYKFYPVEINFEVIGGDNQPEFRVLTDIQWKNK